MMKLASIRGSFIVAAIIIICIPLLFYFFIIGYKEYSPESNIDKSPPPDPPLLILSFENIKVSHTKFAIEDSSGRTIYILADSIFPVGTHDIMCYKKDVPYFDYETRNKYILAMYRNGKMLSKSPLFFRK